jgi:hypothetical protein
MPVKGVYKPNHVEMGKFMLSEQARRPCVEVAQAIVATLATTVTRSKNTNPGHPPGRRLPRQRPPGARNPRRGSARWR